MISHSGAEYYKFNNGDKKRPAFILYLKLIKRFSKGHNVLDFGCGTGILAKLVQKYKHVDCVEIDEYGIFQAKSRNLNVVTDLSFFEESKFDFIYSIHVMEHISNGQLSIILKEFKRVLVPNGRLLIVSPNLTGLGAKKNGNNWIGFLDPTHINIKSDIEWDELFASFGFIKITGFSDGPWNGPYFGLGFIERVVFQILTSIQVLTGLLIFPSTFGESYIAVYEST